MLANWIRMSTTDTGTGSTSLSSVTGYPGVTSQLATDERAAYVYLDSNELPIERGIGYWDGSVWVREKPMATYVSGTYTGANPSAASLPSGTKYLIISPGAQSVMTAAPGLWATTYKAYGDVHTLGSTGTITVAADRAYMIPFVCAVDSDIDAVVLNVNTIGTGSVVCAIYSVGTNGLPGVQLAISGAVSVASTGVKTCTFTRFRPPPRFFVGVLCNGTPTLVSSASAMVLSQSIGAGGGLSPFSHIYQSATSLTFPTTWTPTGALSNANRPMLFVRCA